MLLPDGKYQAVVKDVYLYERGDQKRLTAAFLLDVEHEGKLVEMKHYEWLELNDGSMSKKAAKNLAECFPQWDGTIEALSHGFCCQGVQVQITTENEQDKKDPNIFWTRSRYMDPPGRTGGSTEERLDPAKLGEYASRFNAIGAEARANAPQTQAAPPTPPSAQPPTAPATGRESSMIDCWNTLVDRNSGWDRARIEARWFEILGKVCPGKDSGDLTPAEWGTVMRVIVGMPQATQPPASRPEETEYPF